MACILARGLPAQPDDRQARRLHLLRTFTYVGIVALLAFSAMHALAGAYRLSLIQVAVAAVALLNLVALNRGMRPRLSENVFLVTLLGLLLALLQGSSSATGPIWFAHFAMLAFFLKGNRGGSVWLAALLIGIAGVALLQAAGAVSTPHSLVQLAVLGVSLALLSIGLYIHEAVGAEAERHLARRTEELSQVVKELHQAQEQLRHLAHHDPLTGLPNRTLLYQRLRQSLKLAERHGSRVGVLFLDLDHFKPINDHFGHSAGDEVLRQVARRLTGSLRDSDTVARIGGDEFMVVINDVENQAAARAAADKLVAAIEQPFSVDGRELHLGVSVGLSVFPDHDNDIEALMSLADIDMYRVKTSTRHSGAAPPPH